MTATDDPPSLEHISPRRPRREWIFAWLKNPQAYAVTATMPNFQFSDADARDISAFLMSQSTPYLPAAQHARACCSSRPMPTPQAGASVYGESFCASCHAIENAAGMLVGGNVGPELTRIGIQGEAGVAARVAAQSQDLRSATPRCRITVSTRSNSVCSAASSEAKTDSDLLANVHLEPATPAQDRARQSTGDRTRLRVLPRNQRHQEAG